MSKGGKVTAFVLDGEHVQASEDGMTVPPLPGLWTNTRAMLPEALGLTLTELRATVAARSLPLVEVHVDEKDAHAAFPPSPDLLPSAPATADPVGPPAVDTEPLPTVAPVVEPVAEEPAV